MASNGEEKTQDEAMSPQRKDHLSSLIIENRSSLNKFDVPKTEADDSRAHEAEDMPQSPREHLTRRLTVYMGQAPERLVQVKLRDVSYYVPVKMDAPSVKTVMNQSVCYGTYEFVRRIGQYCKRHKQSRRQSRWRPATTADVFLPFDKRTVLHDVNLVLKPGQTYLVLGPPGCGKTTLLKAIAGLLPQSKNAAKDKPNLTGKIEFNGVSIEDDPGMILPNVVSYVGQLDRHAPLLTVKETFEFAFQCRTGGKHRNVGAHSADLADKLDKENFTENLTIEGLDLAQCADTFVGNEDVRGVSGGQRRRVTVGEMMQDQNPVACADEISTGLDAAVTYDIVHSIVAFSKTAKTTRIMSLLQPGPETFSLFDEVILLAEGYVIYAGPIDEVVEYFAGLGYTQPATMDVADFLQSIPTPDGEMLFDTSKSPGDMHYTSEGFAEAFKASAQYQRILDELNAPSPLEWTASNGKAPDEEVGSTKTKMAPKEFKIKYQNSFYQSTMLNLKRHYTLWWRDKSYIIGKMFENIGMAVATGGILFGQAKITWDANQVDAETSGEINKQVSGVYGALFMTAFHILLGTCTSTPDEVDGRSIHYKHHDANFYQASAFVIGRLVSTFPQRTLEILSFGIPLYWMVGLDPTAGSFFTYIALLICYTIGLKMMFGILAQILPKKANVQGVGTFLVLLLTLFGGFIVYPDVIPNYYIWLYWANPMAWLLQGLASTEYMSSKYDDVGIPGVTFLEMRGFQTGREWIGYSFAYMIPFTLICTVLLTIVLKYVRIEPERSQLKKAKVAFGQIVRKSEENFNIPFTPVDLTFDNLVYEVQASVGKETLRLLNEVSGAFMAGRMCALMGSSGAGKTTLMDVIAMRKTTGTIEGEVRLNGFLQERATFLRCSGYVEQFDVQQAELTVRETVEFNARLRLDSTDPAIGNDEGKIRYTTHVLETMELTDIENLQVGSFEEGGLTFEQRKRLAIACELAGSPSVIFLDEPTSGLDSRGALVVMRAMKRIADTGRTVCATIHQPSSAVFEMFDDLILLKRGGNVVFFGELGTNSVHLVEYFESRGAKPIEYGENPAAWVLRAYAGDSASEDVDWAELYKSSDQYKILRDQIEAIKEAPDESKKITYESAFPSTLKERIELMNRRMVTIYKRSPAYNLTRLAIAVLYSFLIGSVFLRRSDVWEENQVDGVLSTMFLSLIIIGVTSISMAVPVMKKIRDVFYKHRASGMLQHNSLAWAVQVGETPYLCVLSLLFCAIYYAAVGLFKEIQGFFFFWMFFVLNVAIYSYFGQAFICLVRDINTSMALVGALIGYNVFFSGLIVKPQYFVGPFQLGFWTAPGRFAFEGITMTQFADVQIPVVAQTNSPFYFSLNCGSNNGDEPCTGTMASYVQFYFGGKFSLDNFWLDFGVLVGYLILARGLTWFSLKKFNYVNT